MKLRQIDQSQDWDNFRSKDLAEGDERLGSRAVGASASILCFYILYLDSRSRLRVVEIITMPDYDL